MSIPKDAKCCEKIFDGWHYYSCKNKASIERDGKFYCKIHDPVRKEERETVRKQKMEERYEDKLKMMAISNPKYRIMERALELMCEDCGKKGFTAEEIKKFYLEQAEKELTKK